MIDKIIFSLFWILLLPVVLIGLVFRIIYIILFEGSKYVIFEFFGKNIERVSIWWEERIL